jgi:hypothetical protein
MLGTGPDQLARTWTFPLPSGRERERLAVAVARSSFAAADSRAKAGRVLSGTNLQALHYGVAF